MRFVTDKTGLKIILIPKKREYDKNGILREVPGKSIQFVNGVYNTKDKEEIEILKKERLVYDAEKSAKMVDDIAVAKKEAAKIKADAEAEARKIKADAKAGIKDDAKGGFFNRNKGNVKDKDDVQTDNK